MVALETSQGQLLDARYRLEEPIKVGGMGEVWRATHLELDRSFAIKLLPLGAHADQASREHFFREARLSSSLSHPNIVSVTDFGIDEQRGYFLVMELLEGQSLRDRLEDRPLPPRIACDVLDQISSALRYAHGRGVVHCDLKPENIFLVRVAGENRRVNVAKLLDFGLSFRVDLQNSGHGGTPPYVAPERLRSESPTPRADVYALGSHLLRAHHGQAAVPRQRDGAHSGAARGPNACPALSGGCPAGPRQPPRRDRDASALQEPRRAAPDRRGFPVRAAHVHEHERNARQGRRSHERRGHDTAARTDDAVADPGRDVRDRRHAPLREPALSRAHRASAQHCGPRVRRSLDLRRAAGSRGRLFARHREASAGHSRAAALGVRSALPVARARGARRSCHRRSCERARVPHGRAAHEPARARNARVGRAHHARSDRSHDR